MGFLFRTDQLHVTDDWIRCAAGTFAIRDIRNAWVTRRQIGRGSRLVTGLLGVAALLIVIGGAGATGWLAHNWMWVLATPVLFFVAAAIGLLDPVAIYLEKRHHELWIATDTVSVRLWKANSIEVNKALRAIQRARERHREQYEV
jgi:MFS family permease